MSYEDFSYYVADSSGALGPRYYGSNITFVSSYTNVPGDTLYAVPFFVGVEQEVDSLAVWGSAFSPGVMFRCGIYKAGWPGDVDGASIYPIDLKSDGPEVEFTTGDGLQEFPITPIVLGPAVLYYAAYLASDLFHAIFVNQFSFSLDLLGTLSSSAGRNTSWVTSQAYGALPGTFPIGGVLEQGHIHIVRGPTAVMSQFTGEPFGGGPFGGGGF